LPGGAGEAALVVGVDPREGLQQVGLADGAQNAGHHDVGSREVAAGQLDKSLRQALATEEYEHLYAIAFGLLDHYPALGMLFARGCLMEERSLDSDMLMQGVEASRDRLGLSVG